LTEPIDPVELLGSKPRLRLLRVLLNSREINITRLAREAGVTYEAARKHLSQLCAAGLVRERRVGRIRIYSVVQDHPIVPLLRRILSWKSTL